MCRIAAWIGPERALGDVIVAPAHSLLCQSMHATEAKLAVNGDGFGFTWYDGRQAQPGQYRDVLPAWSDGNLPALCRMIRSELFIAHVRASTVGEKARANCHPFTHGRWSFCHNGQFPAYTRLRRQLDAALPDPLYAARGGTTDSEMAFLTMLANGLEDDPAAALRAALAAMASTNGEGPVRATFVFSDGDRLYAFRHASDTREPSLYLSRPGIWDGCSVASEPLDGARENWTEVPVDVLVSVDRAGRVEELAITGARAA